MMSVTVRGEDPVFAAIVKSATPAPDPEPVNVIQLAPVHEDHAHPDGPVTVIVPPPPIAASVMVSGLTVNVHAAAASVTVNVQPAIVIVADLAAVVGLAAAVYPTLPVPVPLAPVEIVTHDAPLVAIQLHPAVVVTVTEPVPPVARSDWVAGEMVYEQVPV
jgi:hypothetical protein